MGQIQVERTDIEGLCIITPTIHQDSRGYFMESYNERDFEEQGLNLRFVQDNQSMSVKGVLRGLQVYCGDCIFKSNIPRESLFAS